MGSGGDWAAAGSGYDVPRPCFRFPESAAIALARAARYGEWRRGPIEPLSSPSGARRDEAKAVIASALARGGGWLDADEVSRLLDCYGLPLVEQRRTSTSHEAGLAADELGGLVALKAVAPGLVHKSDAGAVLLNLTGGAAVQEAAEAMTERLTEHGQVRTGLLVQRMAPEGVELLIGIAHDRQFGPVIACAAGGVVVELLKDVSVRIAPITLNDASEMLAELKIAPLLRGYRGTPACDLSSVEDVLTRLSALAEDLPDVAELDCNPVLASASGAMVLDARVRVEAADPPVPLGGRSRPG